MANADSLTGLMKWLGRDEWRQPFNQLFERHVGPPCERAGIAPDEVADKIGNQNAMVMWGCIFEDFLAYDLDDDSNIVDDYLKRRGWKESVPNKRYMTALRSSVMSLYEVSDIVRDQSFLARDLLRGGDLVRISEKSATHSLKQWDRHYHAVLDQAVPMLENVSPREAAETKKGREKLIAWLKFIENANARQDPHSAMAAYDLGWMWEELGIAHLRR